TPSGKPFTSKGSAIFAMKRAKVDKTHEPVQVEGGWVGREIGPKFQVSASPKQSKAKDADYMKAVESGDMETAQKMVDEAAKNAGYISINDYRMMHTAPDKTSGENLSTIMDNDILPKDYWTHPHYYQADATERSSFYKVKGAVEKQAKILKEGSGRPATIWMYRAVPKNIKDDNFRNGDWISPSREYAKLEGLGIPDGYKIIARRVNVSDVWWDANSINEFGYDDGKSYAYKNTKNNRKLVDPVTYDVTGAVIPLSKRFNPREYSPRYQTLQSAPESGSIGTVQKAPGKAKIPTASKTLADGGKYSDKNRIIARPIKEVGIKYGSDLPDDVYLHGSKKIPGDIDNFSVSTSSKGTLYLTKDWDIASNYSGGENNQYIKAIKLKKDSDIIDLSIKKHRDRLTNLIYKASGFDGSKKQFSSDLLNLSFHETGLSDDEEYGNILYEENIAAILDTNGNVDVISDNAIETYTPPNQPSTPGEGVQKQSAADRLKAQYQARQKETKDARLRMLDKPGRDKVLPANSNKQRLDRAIEYANGDPSKARITPIPSNPKERAISKVAKIFGLKSVLFKTSDPGTRITGFTYPGTKSLFINLSSGVPVLGVSGHEIMHQVEKNHPDLYDYLVKDFQANKKDYFIYAAKEKALREEIGMKKLSDDDLFSEFIGDFASDRFQKIEFWEKLNKKSPTMFGQLVDIIKAVFAKIRRGLTRAEQYVADVDRAENALVDVLAQVVERESKAGKKKSKAASDPVFMAQQKKADQFYSQMRNFLDTKLTSGTAQNIKAQVEAWAKKGEYKQDELEWSGLLDWLDNQEGKVTKQAVMDYLDQSRVVIEEVIKGDSDSNLAYVRNLERERGRRERGESRQEFLNMTLVDINDEILRAGRAADRSYPMSERTKFSQYQTTGGKNYKEVLLTLPVMGKRDKARAEWENAIKKRTGKQFVDPMDLTKQDEKELFKIENMPNTREEYKSSHFDEPNILAHIRMNERTGPNGEKILFLEEIQSDWHQAGRKKGYKNHDIIQSIEKDQSFLGRDNYIVITKDGQKHQINVTSGSSLEMVKKTFMDQFEGPPDAPFKKSWPLLAFKKMVRYAAENGFDQIAWTDGETQAARYDLSKQVDKIRWDSDAGEKSAFYVKKGDTYETLIGTLDQDNNVTVGPYKGRNITDIVGKDIGEKIIKESSGSLSGLDLKIGGSGMKGFYDKILPAEVNKFFGKKSWGSPKVEKTDMGWSIEVTPEMRDKALYEGIPMFQTSDIRYQVMDKATAYEENRKNNRNIKIKAFTSFNKFKGELVKGVDKFLGSISTRLKLINQKLAEKIRTLDYDINTKYANDIKIALPLLEKAKKMTRDDYADWDFARKNSDGDKLKELNEKYGMTKEYKAVREMLDRIRKEAIDVGYEVGEIEEYWPRVLKDQEGFLKAIDRGPERPEFTDALKKKAKDMGIEVWELDPMQRADIISNMILGKYYGIPGPGSVKQRFFDTIPVEFNRFYMDSDAALMNHLHSMRKRIEARKFFGKVPEKITTAKQRLRLAETKLRETDKNDTDRVSDLESRIAEYRAVIEKYKNQNDFTDNIGSYIDELIVNGDIKPEQENTVKEILTARFNERGATGNWQAYKNFSYMDTMGSPISAITQIGDLAWSMYEGGVFPTVRNVFKSITNKSRITKEDVGVERIAQEFADSDTLSNAVSKVFKWVGLEKMDSIGKEALLNTAFEKFKQEAAKNPTSLKQKIRPIFENETGSVIQDLLNDDVTENVKRLVYGRLLDFQPVGLSEMPEKYLTAGNGRVFYMLKTFTLKQFDIFRREVYHDLKNGNAKQKAEAMKRFVYLSSLFVLANAGADELKDWLLGRNTDLSDRVVDNVLRLFGVSKFVTWKARTEGVGSAMTRQILPPFKFIDALTKDVVTAGDDKGLKTIESIPVVGKLAYWHMGRGANSENELWDTRLSKEKARLNKVEDRLERAKNKQQFIEQNRSDLAARRKINKMQGKLNMYRKRINNLKKQEQTKEVVDRIEKLENTRTGMIKKYFGKDKK
ncbi:hypothetical protein C4588_03265, partial [Candidatus Parcubacteria bacterium]